VGVGGGGGTGVGVGRGRVLVVGGFLVGGVGAESVRM
jgi:hypothetical protein